MTPGQEIEFLGMIVHSKEINISLLQEKSQSIKQMWQDMYLNPEITVFELAKVLCHLTSTILAILPAKLHCHFLQQQQIQALKKNCSYDSQLFKKELRKNLNWRFFGGGKNIKIHHGRSLLQLPAQTLLHTDASLTGLGAVCEEIKTGGTWNQQERSLHINELELLALKLSLETFLKAQEIKSLHIQMANIVALTYCLKMRGGHKKLRMVCLCKHIWELLLRKKITVTALNKHADI